jgi:hypothetical protein
LKPRGEQWKTSLIWKEKKQNRAPGRPIRDGQEHGADPLCDAAEQSEADRPNVENKKEVLQI